MTFAELSPQTELITRAAQNHEISEVAELVASAFADGEARVYERILNFWLAHLPDRPGFSAENLRVGVVRKKIVSAALVRQYTMRYGGALLKVAGIGSVCTHVEYRKRGYASALMQDVLAYVAEQGAHLALLHGRIPHFYENFGFSPVFPKYYMTFSTAGAAELPAYLTIREAQREDLPQLAWLYETHWGGRVTFTRSPDIWRWRFDRVDSLLVADDDRGNLGGYLLRKLDDNIEVVANSPEAVTSLMAWSGSWFSQRSDEQVSWFVPPDDAIVTYARQFLPINVSVLYQPTAGWMARLIDSSGLLQTLLSELIQQVISVQPNFDANALMFDLQPDRVHIGLSHQRETYCDLSHHDFIQVMFGSLRPAALATRSHIHPEGIKLLDLLFPPRMAALAPWDWF